MLTVRLQKAEGVTERVTEGWSDRGVTEIEGLQGLQRVTDGLQWQKGLQKCYRGVIGEVTTDYRRITDGLQKGYRRATVTEGLQKIYRRFTQGSQRG